MHCTAPPYLLSTLPCSSLSTIYPAVCWISIYYLCRYLFEYLLTFPLALPLFRLRAAVTDVVRPGVEGVNVQHFHCLDLNIDGHNIFTYLQWIILFIARPEYVEVEAVLGLVGDGVPHPGQVLPVLPAL